MSTKDKQPKKKTPSAYQINPMIMEQLKPLRPEEMPMFILSEQQMIPPHIRTSYTKTLKALVLEGVGGLVCGVGLNMVLTRTVPKVLIMSTAVRIPVRLAVLTLPFGFFAFQMIDQYHKLNDMNQQMFLRIRKLIKTGDIQAYMK